MQKKSFLIFSFFCFLTRGPSFFYPYPFNPDEALIGAGALRQVYFGFVPWRDLESIGFGPITNWPAGLMALTIIPVTFTTLHILAGLNWAFSATLTLWISSSLFGRIGAYFSAVLLLGISILGWTPDFLHLSGASFPNLFLLFAACCLVLGLNKSSDDKFQMFYAALVGFFCSLAALGKLQALPPGFFLCLFTGHGLLLGNYRATWRGWVACLLGGLAPWIFLGGWLAYEGELQTAIDSYFKGGISYALKPSDPASWLMSAGRDLLGGWMILKPLWILNFLLLPGIGMWLFAGGKTTIWRSQKVVFIFGWFSATLVALLMPSNRWCHHAIFLIPPAVVLTAGLFVAVYQPLAGERGVVGPLLKWIRKDPLGYGGLVLGACLAFNVPLFPSYVRSKWSPLPLAGGFSEPQRALIDYVEKSTGPQDAIVIWGWAPEIHVATGRPSGTRHIISHPLIDPNSAREIHRQNFMKDLQASQPVLIVDAACPGFFLWRWGDGSGVRTDSFPELKKYVEENYQGMSLSIQGTSLFEIKVYRRVN